jgi:4-hydroxy-tetrahydrodipicolinate synthase
MQKLRGVYVVSITPFNEDGTVDYTGLRRNVDWWISQGVHGILPIGSTGEFASLEDSERYEVAATVVDAARGRVPVVVGASAETTSKTIALARHAKDIGAAGLLVLPSYFYRSTQEEIYQHFKMLSDAVSLPVIVYNNPRSAKVDILPETVKRLAQLPRIDYIKESSNDIKRITEIRTATDDGIGIFCGCEHMSYESFIMGAIGWVCVIANIAPRMAVQLYQHTVEQRNLEAGWELYQQMLPMLRYFEEAGKTQRTLKHILESRGLAGGGVRRPKLPLTAADKERIDRLAKGLE